MKTQQKHAKNLPIPDNTKLQRPKEAEMHNKPNPPHWSSTRIVTADTRAPPNPRTQAYPIRHGGKAGAEHTVPQVDCLYRAQVLRRLRR